MEFNWRGSRKLAIFLPLPALASLCGCNGGFSGALATPPVPSGDCSTVISASPAATSVRVPANSTSGTTFGIVNSGQCTVVYTINGVSQTRNAGNPFITLLPADFTTGTNTVVATASNGSTTSTQTWTVMKNTPPTISGQTPPSAGNAINYLNNITLSANVTDANGDPITATWLLNGSPASGVFTTSNSGGTYQAIFQPTISQLGGNTVTLQVYDGYDTSSVDWSVTVTSSTAAVASCTPGSTTPGAPDVITSTGTNSSRTYSINASGTGLTYSWLLKQPGGSSFTPIAAKTTAVITLTQSDLPAVPGIYTLNAQVTDAYNNTAQCPAYIYIKSNAKPVFSGTPTPPTASVAKLNVKANAVSDVVNGQAMGFTPGTGGVASDANGDALTYTWTLDGIVNNAVLPSGSFSSVFNPNGDTSLLGNHTVSVTVSDGYESSSVTWNVNLNYFSTFCNNLAPGSICTLVGNPLGVGSGLDPTVDQTLIRTQPRYFVLHQVGAVYNIAWTDQVSNTVWYYNRTSSPVSYFGTTIEAGKIRPIFGSGQPGALSTSSPTKGSTPLGITINNDNPNDPVLYVALYGNNRVLAISNSLGIQAMFNGTATNNGTAISATSTGATGAACTNPWGIDYKAGSNTVYVSCYSDQSIRSIDVSTPSAPMTSILVKAATGFTIDGSIGTAGTAATAHPRGVKVDGAGNVYWTEACSGGGPTYRRGGVVRVYSPSGFTFGSTTVSAGTVGTLVGSKTNSVSSCTNTIGGATAMTAAILQDPYDVTFYPSTGAVTGLFISNGFMNRILFANETGSTQKFGGLSGSTVPTQIATGHIDNSVGTGGASTTADGGAGILTQISGPEGVATQGNTLYFADYGFMRLRTLDPSSGTVSTVLGAGYQRAGAAPSGVVPATQVFMNNPMDVVVDSNENNLYYTDTSNQRIVQVNLTTGAAAVFAGNGSTNYGDNVSASLVGMSVPMGITHTGNIPSALAAFGKQLLYADASTSAGTNLPCLLRSISENTGTSSVFGLSSTSGDVVSPMGLYSSGCTNAVTTNTNFTGSGTSFPLFTLQNIGGFHRSIAVAQDNSGNPVLYMALTERHCILKIDQTGAVSPAVGICQSTGGDAGNVAISTTSTQLTAPTGIYTDPNYPTNLFIADQSNQGTVKIKYANFSSSNAQVFTNVSVPGGNISSAIFTISSGTPYLNSVAANANQICYSTGYNLGNDTGFSNVQCKNRLSTSGASPVILCGAADNTTKDGGPLGTEQEGKTCLSSSIDGSVILASPSGLTFDSTGNLYIVDRHNHIIRMVARWY